MLQQINKKIIFYISLVIILGTFNNKNLKNFDLPKIDKVNIEGIEFNNNEFLNFAKSKYSLIYSDDSKNPIDVFRKLNNEFQNSEKMKKECNHLS